ncbi:MAG: stage II sporulation protein P [Gracilibacteraceae bacterium]|nr:stage II sporulation protein P [Gracilibacteraceae bacterium]
MNKKWLFALILIFAVVILFLFLKWLHSPEPYLGESGGSLTDTAEVFSYYVEKRLRLEEYSNNIYIQMLNIVMTGVKVNYEKEYGCPMPGLIESAVSRITDGLHTDAGNPITYLNFTFTAFSQYDPSLFTYAEAGGSGTAPNITDFEDVPEGAIYFSEEDEYKAEELINGQQPFASTGSQISQIAEDSIGMPGEIALDSKSPQILIYHSHSTESYMPNTAGNYHTQNDKYNVVAVGSRLAKELEDKYKYKVLHDKTKHDKESYAYSYANSLQTIKNSINKYKSIKVIIDLHRDAFDAEKATFAEKTAKKAEYTTSINGKRAARIMLVIAKENPNYAELEKFAVYIKKKMDKLYPGLFLKIDVKSRGKYNLYFSNHSMLVEIGCMLNTIEEAQYSAELFARVIGEVINDLKE